MPPSTAEGQPNRITKARATAAKMRVRTVLPFLHAIAATAKPRTADSYGNITGVPLWGQQHYVHGYRCADGTTVPRARVNDDVCDCSDGGDEPGTAACAGRQLLLVRRGPALHSEQSRGRWCCGLLRRRR